VTVASGGTLKNSNFGLMTFHDTLLVDPAATYNVFNTAFNEIDTLPNLPYTHLYLGKGTNITLTENISTFGTLSLDAPTLGDQELTLNGHTVNVGGTFITQFNGRITMTDPLDVLTSANDANFWGGDEAGHLTAGTIMVSKNFSQQATHSDKSFRSTGTLVQFPFSGSSHGISFATPDSSYFADVSSIITNPLSLTITGRMKATGTVGGNTTNISGDSLDVGVLSAGLGGGNVNLTWLKAGSISGSFGTFNVGTTELAGTGVLPLLNYGLLRLSGDYTIPSLGGSIAGSLTIASGGSLTGGNNAANLVVTNDVIVDGGLLDLNGDNVSVAGNFVTQNGGLLNSTAPGSGLTILGSASFDGGNEIGRLTAGTMGVQGDFSILGAGPSFRADSLFTVNFNGGGTHDINIDIVAPTQYFGELGIHSALDTLNFTFAGERWVYKLAATGGSVINANLNGIQAERLAVNGAVFNQTPIHVNTASDQPEAFDAVTYTGFGAGDIQLFFDHPNHPGSFTFNGINFDDASLGTYLLTNRNGGTGSFTINMGGPDSSTHVGHDNIGPNTTVNWGAGF
jgi:hypothetical protein